jgi:hypothetical protein
MCLERKPVKKKIKNLWMFKLGNSFSTMFQSCWFCWWRKISVWRKPLTCNTSLTNFIT